MKKLKLFPFVVLCLCLAIALPSVASDTSASAAFERMKKLAGAWNATTPDGKNVRVTYEVIANGSAVVERESPAGDHAAMETVYHLDGNKLVLEHYCMAGNQPRMSASAYDPQTGELKFDFVSAGNLKSANDGYMHNATFRFINDNQFGAEWTFFENGKAKFAENIQYKRVE